MTVRKLATYRKVLARKPGPGACDPGTLDMYVFNEINKIMNCCVMPTEVFCVLISYLQNGQEPRCKRTTLGSGEVQKLSHLNLRLINYLINFQSTPQARW